MFAKALNSISSRHHTSQVFDDFLQMAVCAYSMGRSEELYLDIAKKYNQEEIKGIGESLGALISEHEKQNNSGEWKDFLGNYFEEFGQNNSKMGQFFTPVSICNLMADFLLFYVKSTEKVGFLPQSISFSPKIVIKI